MDHPQGASETGDVRLGFDQLCPSGQDCASTQALSRTVILPKTKGMRK